MCEICDGSGFLKWIDAWAFKDAWAAGHVPEHLQFFRADMACPACRPTQATNTARALLATRGQPFEEPVTGFNVLQKEGQRFATVAAEDAEYPFTQ